MNCPNCGAEQPESFECIQCGIVFAKFAEVHERQRETLSENPRGLAAPLGRVGRIVRGLAGVTCLVLAVLMGMNGTALNAFGPYVAMILFGGAGLYFLVSIMERMKVRRFVVEGALVAASGVIVLLSLPEVFSLDQPIYKSTIDAPLPREGRIFVQEARARMDAIRTFLGASEIGTPREAVAMTEFLGHRGLTQAFMRLPRDDQPAAQEIHLRLHSLNPLMETLANRAPNEIPLGPAVWLPESVSRDVFALLNRLDRELQAMEAELNRRDEALRAGGTQLQ